MARLARVNLDNKKPDAVYIRFAERETRFELATLALARRCSTTEPFAHNVLRLIFIARFNVDYYIIKGLKCQHFF